MTIVLSLWCGAISETNELYYNQQKTSKNGQVSQRDNDPLEVPEKHMAAFIKFILQTFLIFFHILRANSIGREIHHFSAPVIADSQDQDVKLSWSGCTSCHVLQTPNPPSTGIHGNRRDML